MSINKVIYGNNTLIDLTSDTITANDLRIGVMAHGADGEQITGTLNTATIEPIVFDYNCGYIATGAWIYENPTNTYIDIYEVIAEHEYFLTLGINVGSRFRTLFTTEDIRTKTSGRGQGTSIIKDVNDPPSCSNFKYTPEVSGYMLIAKDNIGKTGIKTYCYDVTVSWL